MSRSASKEIKTSIIHQKQKNGDIYVLERKRVFDPEKGYTKIVSSKLIGKIPNGSREMVPTRPKKKNKKNDETDDFASHDEHLTASRIKTGMMSIIDHIGKESGIDDGVYNNTDLGTAQKIISLARYLIATNGQSLPGITTFQLTHKLPYAEGINENIYSALFREIGRDESLQQGFFLNRCSRLGSTAVLAYDSTTISTYSENLSEARQGYNKANDGLDTVKLITLYSIDARQPVAFTKQPGNIPDVISIGSAIKQLEGLGVKKAIIVSDNGFYSEENLADMLHEHYNFITLSKVNIKWIKAVLEEHNDELEDIESAVPFDPLTRAVTSKVMHTFKYTRKYASKKKGLSKGDEMEFTRKVYVHIYFNATKRNNLIASFDNRLLEIKKELESGREADELSVNAQKKIEKYFKITKKGGKTVVSFNKQAVREAKKYYGYFALVTNCEKDPFKCLQTYRKRETIESFFESGKERADGMRTRVWDTDALRGRMFVQFVALCYYEYINEKLRQMKERLGVENGDPKHDLKTNINKEKKLKSWLVNTPTYLILQWFDTLESVEISRQLSKKRWSTEMTARDQMFLKELGLEDN